MNLKKIELRMNGIFLINDFQVEFYLTTFPERHYKIFKILKNNPKILKDYENLKTKFNGKKYRDYQEAKI